MCNFGKFGVLGIRAPRLKCRGFAAVDEGSNRNLFKAPRLKCRGFATVDDGSDRNLFKSPRLKRRRFAAVGQQRQPASSSSRRNFAPFLPYFWTHIYTSLHLFRKERGDTKRNKNTLQRKGTLLLTKTPSFLNSYTIQETLDTNL